MSEYENKPGSGALFKRDKKNERQPDYSGPFYEKVGNGVVERQIAAWIRKSRKGETFLSLQVSDRYDSKSQKGEDGGTEAPSKEFDSDLPF